MIIISISFSISIDFTTTTAAATTTAATTAVGVRIWIVDYSTYVREHVHVDK